MNEESLPTTLVVQMTMDRVESTGHSEEEISLEEEQSFVLGSLVDHKVSRTYSPFMDAFDDIAALIPRTLTSITPRGRFVHVFVDLGPHHRGQFDAWVDGRALKAPRPADGAAFAVVDRHERRGFVFELRHKERRRSVRVSVRFGVRGIRTLVTRVEALEFLREYIVPRMVRGNAAEALAVAIDAYEEGRHRSRPEVVRRTVDAAASRLAMSPGQLKDATRYAYRQVFIWVVEQPVRARHRPDREKWMKCLAALELDEIARDPAGSDEFRERNTVEGLVDLAAALTDTGVLTRDDVAHLLDESEDRA